MTTYGGGDHKLARGSEWGYATWLYMIKSTMQSESSEKGSEPLHVDDAVKPGFSSDQESAILL